MNEMTAKAAAASMSTLRVPKMAPNQMATRVTSICATVWEVDIQAPSSKPAWTAPRMSASPRLDSRVLRVEMKVPIRTAVRPSHGNEVAGGGGGVVGAIVAGGEVDISSHPTGCRRSRLPTYRGGVCRRGRRRRLLLF